MSRPVSGYRTGAALRPVDRPLTESELSALKYIAVQMDASSIGICRTVFPERKSELAAAGAAVAGSLRRKGLAMRGHCLGTWRLTAKGREAAASYQQMMTAREVPTL